MPPLRFACPVTVIIRVDRLRLHFYERENLSKIIDTNETENINKIELLAESRRAFRKAMKIAYFKEFNKKGLITDDELEKLIALQNADKGVQISA